MITDILASRGQAEAPATASGTSAVFDPSKCSVFALDITVTAFVGGTTPNITFALERLGADEIWYRVWQAVAITAAGAVSYNFSPGAVVTAAAANDAGSDHAVLTSQARLAWTFGGGVVATSTDFSYSLIGKRF